MDVGEQQALHQKGALLLHRDGKVQITEIIFRFLIH